jgi:hypothetical protein
MTPSVARILVRELNEKLPKLREAGNQKAIRDAEELLERAKKVIEQDERRARRAAQREEAERTGKKLRRKRRERDE